MNLSFVDAFVVKQMRKNRFLHSVKQTRQNKNPFHKTDPNQMQLVMHKEGKPNYIHA